ncbi:class II aldolase/adducin family protein [Streptomyces sp. uw30]|uniref:class II aldolase/adducin family protein n=1 Tax=Streptomyces sp. uw30 TaxID=1828179 RepID=UPI0021C9A09B|nr:class II aldolase/adducin family protein [Streptomyces sp. uw30]
MAAALGGPVRVAPYATYGTDELAENMLRALTDRTACLLQNHGTLDAVSHTRHIHSSWAVRS